MRLPRLALALALTLPATLSVQAANYLRYPALRGDTLMFTAEGDLWRASSNGGKAQRLTTHAAEEARSSISPDGKWVAFSAAYEGPLEAYVMPSAGGQPKRISFEGFRAFVIGWTPQGEVLYSAQNQRGPNAQRVISAVNPLNLQRRVLPLAEATEATLDDSGQMLYFTRMGLQLSNDNAKKYKGGEVAQLWRFDLKKQGEAERLPVSHKGSDKQPMWWQGRVYFISDRDGNDNLWSINPDGSDPRQLTRHSGWDVRNAAMDNGRIVYQLGADIHILEVASNRDQTVNIELVSDFDQQRTRLLKNPLAYLTSGYFAANGERVVITARGHVAIAGLGQLRRVEVNLPKGSRAREAQLSPDGKWVYAICDASGEHEIWRFPADGSPGGQALTHDGQYQRTSFTVSPDGKQLAHFNKRGELFLIDIASGKNQKIDHSDNSAEYNDLVWSADSRLLALSRANSVLERGQVALYDVSQHKLHWLTSDKYQSGHVSFTPDGNWLYFISERHFQSSNPAPWGDRNMGPYFEKRGKIYAYALKPARFPFQSKNELDAANSVTNPAANAAATAAAPGSAPASPVEWSGLAKRLFEVPIAPGNYSQLQSDGKRLYFLERDGDKTHLKTLTMDDSGAQPELFAPEVRHYEVSANNKKVYFQKAARGAPGDMFIVDAGAKAAPDLSKAGVALNNWQISIQPREEWEQIFHDAWRMHRDFFFDSKMRGIDWVATRKKYLPLLERVHERNELNDVLGMMSAELGTLHSQIVPGELRKADDGSTPAFLGAMYEREPDGFRISHIYQTEAELPGERSPLAQPSVQLQVGDVILAVNGKPAKDANDMAQLLANQVGQQLLLKVKHGAQQRNVIVTPVNAERNNSLRYSDWEQTSLKRVEQVGQGRIGYLHLRAMTPPDIATFAREFYAHIGRDGLIIDVRRNNGGNIDSWIIEKLLRRTWSAWHPRDGKSYTNTQQTFRGHLVVLADELTYSDGETFTAAVQALKLGPVVGKRTAGAGVWLGDANVLVDNGRARVAEHAVFSLDDGRWLVEGVGVAPDVEVENMPHASFKGQDQQLETALKMLLEKIRSNPVEPHKSGPIDPVGAR
ncbi:MAG: hypothetical protein RL748_764 [Pseudomonadota bacterium]